MFKNLFSKGGDRSKTGFFKVSSENELIPLEFIPGNGSINNAIESMGYPINHIRIVNTYRSNRINCLGFKTLSKELVLVLAKNTKSKISFSDVLKETEVIDWSFEYSSLNIEDILDEGIRLKNFDFDFLNSVIRLTSEDDNLYRSDELGLYFRFDQDMLIAYTSTGWENSSTKWLKNLNKNMVKRMIEEASLYHTNEIDTMTEVNNQTQSLLNIPHIVDNEFIALHRNENNNVNFYNLLMVHYSKNCKLSDFQFMNKGRYKKIAKRTYIVGNFIYEFDFENKLKRVLAR